MRSLQTSGPSMQQYDSVSRNADAEAGGVCPTARQCLTNTSILDYVQCTAALTLALSCTSSDRVSINTHSFGSGNLLRRPLDISVQLILSDRHSARQDKVKLAIFTAGHECQSSQHPTSATPHRLPPPTVSAEQQPSTSRLSFARCMCDRRASSSSPRFTLVR